MSDKPNHFVWYELLTTDLDAATRFYEDVVGWTVRDSGMPNQRYMILSAGSRMAAGAMTIPPEAASQGARPGWVGYIDVPDVDAAAEKVTAAGGAVHRPPDEIPGVGRFAVVADPHGAVFSLFRPAGEAPDPAPPMSPGHVGWHELSAGDGPEAFAFYAAQFGWSKDTAMDMGPMGLYQMFRVGGPMAVGAVMTKPPQIPHPFWLFYFVVPDIDAAVTRVTAGGGQILNGPMEVPGGSWIIQAADPQGAAFALVAPPKQA